MQFYGGTGDEGGDKEYQTKVPKGQENTSLPKRRKERNQKLQRQKSQLFSQ